MYWDGKPVSHWHTTCQDVSNIASNAVALVAVFLLFAAVYARDTNGGATMYPKPPQPGRTLHGSGGTAQNGTMIFLAYLERSSPIQYRGAVETEVYYLEYWTSGYKASAQLALPTCRPPAGGWPLVALCHSLKGYASSCNAISGETPSDGFIPFVKWWAGSGGLAYLAVDYPGIGTRASVTRQGVRHVYGGRENALSILDGLRAVVRTFAGRVNPQKVGLSGGSLGANVALTALKYVEDDGGIRIGPVVLCAPTADSVSYVTQRFGHGQWDRPWPVQGGKPWAVTNMFGTLATVVHTSRLRPDLVFYDHDVFAFFDHLNQSTCTESEDYIALLEQKAVDDSRTRRISPPRTIGALFSLLFSEELAGDLHAVSDGGKSWGDSRIYQHGMKHLDALGEEFALPPEITLYVVSGALDGGFPPDLIAREYEKMRRWWGDQVRDYQVVDGADHAMYSGREHATAANWNGLLNMTDWLKKEFGRTGE